MQLTIRNKKEVEDIEIHLLLDAIYDQYGFDFKDYAVSSLKRRIFKCMLQENLTSISSLQEKILHEESCIDRLLNTISVDVTSMFRDPLFYRSVRQNILPRLKDFSFIRIWHAGCATGEEVYSFAIMLKEENLYDKCRIYATDMNATVVNKANEGISPLSSMPDFTENYIKAGGKKDFSEYYTANYGNAIFVNDLKKNIVWAHHNLVNDASFNEFHIVFCRNVMIYFNSALQERVHKLIYDSLPLYGFLCLGNKETLIFTPYENDYEQVDEKEKIYRKIK